MNKDSKDKLNRLLQENTSIGLIFSAWLKNNGYSDKLVEGYRKSGWLSALSRGVMFRIGDKLRAFEVLESYNGQLKRNFRIASHSALEHWSFGALITLSRWGKPFLAYFSLCY